MDVRCARCGIEYEFDDALISERGTMVRCTECGHQFRIHPSHVIPGAPEEWRVITRNGQALVYKTLRELQQGITQGQIGREATLIRGSSAPRPLGTIAELDPFFPTHAAETREQSTLTGVAPPSLVPDERKPSPPPARMPIARIGLNSVQVSASGVGLSAPRAVTRPRKTTLGMGEPAPKEEKPAPEVDEETHVMPQASAIKTPAPPPPEPAPAAVAAPAAARVPTDIAAPAPLAHGAAPAAAVPTASPEPARAAVTTPTATTASKPTAVPVAARASAPTPAADAPPPSRMRPAVPIQSVSARPTVTNRQPAPVTSALSPAASTDMASVPKPAPTTEAEPAPQAPAPVAQPAEAAAPKKAESKPPPPRKLTPIALRISDKISDKPLPAKASDRPPPAKPALQKPEQSIQRSDPPTLRDGETSPIATKAGGSQPPRPARHRGPTLVGGLDAPVPTAATTPTPTPAKAHAPILTASEPPAVTDPPLAVRTLRDETRLIEPQARRGDAAPATHSNDANASVHAIVPPAPELADSVDESVALNFQAEAPPIESASSFRNTPVSGVPVASQPASEADEMAAFVPTVPPKRMLTQTDGLAKRDGRARGSSSGRWLVAGLLLVLLSLGVLLWRSRSSQPSAEPTPAGPNLEQYLRNASDALHAGDLVRAHDQLQASQTAGGRDARWAILTARYDVMRADMNWLAVRLADPSDATHVEALKRELLDNLAQATRALSAVEKLSVNQPEAAAARLDAQRLRGELASARKSADELSKLPLTPEIAYSLATLELTADSPNYKQAFDWLGIARAADSGLGRAPVVLMVACVTGQRLDAARAELARLKAASRSHPLLAEMEAFITRATALAAVSAEAAASAAPEASAAAAADTPSNGEAPTAASGDALADVMREGDARLRLRRGVEALGRSELTRAELYFRSVLAGRPTDTEALTGMGDVARRRGNTANAINYYQKVLASNGQYLPALSALADVKRRSGDTAGAIALYKRIVDQVGESPGYGQTAAQRLHELTGAANKSGASSEGEKSTPSPAAAGSASSEATDHAGKQP